MMVKKGIIIILAVLIFTFFRSLLILVGPFVILFIAYLYKAKLTPIALLSIIVLAISLLVNIVFYDFYLVNTIASILLLFIGVCVLLLKPKANGLPVSEWMNTSSYILLLVNATALVNFFYVFITGDGLLDDSFNGLYGRSGLSMHTLCIVNFIYAVYFLDQKKNIKFVLFFLSGVMCFYGLGLILFLVSLILAFGIRLKTRYIKYILLSPIVLIVLLLIITRVNPNILSYMNKNINRVTNSISLALPYEEEMEDVRNFETVKTPRKILMFKGSIKLMSAPHILLFGAGPGTYNSRTSFLLNGEYTSNKYLKRIKIEPEYAKRDIYPLWNENITFQYNDGTRNEPFSSIIALATEYGLINAIIIIVGIFYLYRKTLNYNRENKLFVRFLFIFSSFNLLSENYFEYPEFMILFIILVKGLEYKNESETYAEKA